MEASALDPDPPTPTHTTVPPNMLAHARRVLQAAGMKPVDTVPIAVRDHAARVLEQARAGRFASEPDPRFSRRADPRAALARAALPSRARAGSTYGRDAITGDPTPADIGANLRRMRRALFIGIDGVLHPVSAIAGGSPMTRTQLLPRCPDALVFARALAELLVGREDIGVVVSSSWCMFLDDAQIGRLLNVLAPWYCGTVGKAYRGHDAAIRSWATAHPQLQSFAVLDDSRNFLPGALPELIGCSAQHGLGDPRVRNRLQHWLEHGQLLP